MLNGGPHKDRMVRIASGRSFNLGNAKSRNLSWGMFCKLFAKPQISNERRSQYKKFTLAAQNDLKAGAGWYLGAPIKGKTRNNSSIEDRDIVTLDLDKPTVELFEQIKSGEHPICKYEFVAHTTRSHDPESPRLRINILLSDILSRDKFLPFTRILAHGIDETMEAVDKVSFRLAQMMFMPTVSKDQEYEVWRNEGELCDVNTVLNEWGVDWTDYGNLPYAVTEDVERQRERKAEDPWQKTGVIGAFCRAWPIEDLIAEHMSDIYGDPDPLSKEPRYTYLQGHGSHGACIYDDGRFLYSNHGSDPASDQNLNAFDLYRVHFFGDKDENKDLEDKPITSHPSYKAMVEFAQKDPETIKALMEDEYDLMAMFDEVDDLDDEEIEDLQDVLGGGRDIDEEIADVLGLDELAPDVDLPPYPKRPRKKKPEKGWTKDLEVTKDGTIKSTLYNVSMIIMNDPRMMGAIARNTFNQRVVTLRPIKSKLKVLTPIEVEDRESGLALVDAHDATIRALFEAPSGEGRTGWGMKVSERDLREAILLVSESNRFHPVIEKLTAVEWDGQERLSTLFIDYLGTDDHPYFREIAEKFLCGLIARLFHPGHKFDYVPILMGRQGIRKTTFVETLAMGWDGELTAEMSANTDAVEQMLGKWILELGELDNMRRSEVEAQKAFISRTTDRVRLSYDKRMGDFPRQCLFMGTTNAAEYLKDDENRRYWPVPVTVESIDTDKLREEMPQIWAEALIAYKRMIAKHDYRRLPFYLSPEATEKAQQLQSSAKMETSDDMELARIENWLETPVPVETFEEDGLSNLDNVEEDQMAVRTVTCAMEIMDLLYGVDMRNRNHVQQQSAAIGRVMKRIWSWAKYEDVSPTKTDKLVFPEYGRQRPFVLRAAKHWEIKRGFKLVKTQPADEEDDVL